MGSREVSVISLESCGRFFQKGTQEEGVVHHMERNRVASGQSAEAFRRAMPSLLVGVRWSAP